MDTQEKLAEERNKGFEQFAATYGKTLLDRDASLASIDKLVRKVDVLADQEIGKIHAGNEAAAEQGLMPRVACGKGCSHCCFQRVSASIPEVLHVGSYVRANFSEEEIAALKARVEATMQFRQGLKAGQPYVWPCPFLVDDVCTVFEARPLVCRGFESFDVEACKLLKFAPGNVSVPRPKFPMMLTRAFAAGVRRGTGHLESFRYDLELATGINAVLADEDLDKKLFAGIKAVRHLNDAYQTGNDSLIKDSRFGLLRSREEYEAYWHEATGFEPSTAPTDIDFNTTFLVYCHLGSRPTTGYSVTVGECDLAHPNLLRIVGVETVPGPATKVTQMETHPYVVYPCGPWRGQFECVLDTFQGP